METLWGRPRRDHLLFRSAGPDTSRQQREWRWRPGYQREEEGGLPTCSRTCGAGRVHRARQKPAVSSRRRPEEWGKETQAKKHPGAQERAQGEDHHDEGAFSTMKVGMSRYGRWWYRFKMRCCLAFSLAGDYLASASEDGVLVIWNIASGAQVASTQFENPVSSLVWDSRHQTRLFVGCVDGISVYIDNYQVQSYFFENAFG